MTQNGTQHGAKAPSGAASAETLSLVRQNVRGLLQQSPAFLSLPPERQREIANQTVQIASYLAEPDGIPANRLRPQADPYALAQDTGTSGSTRSGRGGDANDPTKFTAQAAREGAAAAGALLREIDFPNFVSGLINGVFHSIVSSSIEQMEAYGKLVADVAKTLNQFRDENVSVNQGRDHLVETFPDTFMLDMEAGEDGGPRVRLRDGVDEREALRQVSGLPVEGSPLTSLDDDLIEERLVPAARTQLATSRQQLLATMVLMGINRIVVTDGRIAAKVMFDFQARDNFRYQSSATKFDYDKSLRKNTSSGEYESDYRGGEYTSSYSKESGYDSQRRDASYYSKGKYQHASEPVLKLAKVETSQTDAALTSKASLMGSVEVNFKSDYLPLEKMADSFQIARIQEAARPAQVRATPGAPVPAGAAPASPVPAQPGA